LATWKKHRRLSDDQLLAGAEHWRAIMPPMTPDRAAHTAWMDQYRAWCLENGTNPLELIRMARAESGKNY
jgi:hypothetical protein